MTKATITVGAPRRSGGWNPVQGEAFSGLLAANGSLSPDEKDRLVIETGEILADCVDPQAVASTNTGLVIGYVQSGKTLSFTALTALARDNKYQVVILLAGTTNNLGCVDKRLQP